MSHRHNFQDENYSLDCMAWKCSGCELYTDNRIRINLMTREEAIEKSKGIKFGSFYEPKKEDG